MALWTGDPPVFFGKLWCPECSGMTWFVSWEEGRTKPEDAECRECGFKFPTVVETVVDPVTFVAREQRRHTLDPEVFAAARAAARAEFIAEAISSANAKGLPFNPQKLAIYVGPNPPDR